MNKTASFVGRHLMESETAISSGALDYNGSEELKKDATTINRLRFQTFVYQK